MLNVSPAVTAAVDESAPFHRALPEDSASHNEKCEYVSVVETFVHVTVPLDAISPPEAALNEIDLRVASVAAPDVAVSPGSLMWSFTHTAATAPEVFLKLFRRRSSM